uniref:Putative peptidase family m13 includes neprilysin n=1 Tax=Amblyomma cajennense TaxID=34607 RepID=A0A023FRI9_AMBCJ
MILRIALGILCVTICASEGTPDSKGKVCTDAECKEFVKEIESQMGTATPCENLYENVCGKWRGSLELQKKPLKEKAVKDLADLLEAARVEPKESPNATDKLINAFQSCTLQAKSVEALKASVKSVLDGYKLGQWPLQGDATGKQETYEEILQKVGPLPLFTHSVSLDKSEPVITISKPSYDYVSGIDNDDGDYPQYNDYEENMEEAYKEFITKTMILLSGTTTEEQSKAADGIIFVEKTFSKFASAAINVTKTGSLSYIKTELRDDFLMKALKRDFDLANVSIKEETQVEVEYFQYFEKVAEFLKNADTTQLINYVLWTKIRNMTKAVATPLNELYLVYKNKTDIEPRKRSNDTKLLCMQQLLERDIMYTAGASYYSSDKFDKDSKEDVMKMLHFINSTFRNVIKTTPGCRKKIRKKPLNVLITYGS